MPTDTRNRQTTARGGNQKGKQGEGEPALQLSLFPSSPRLVTDAATPAPVLLLLLLLLVTNAIKTQKRRVSFPLSVTMGIHGGEVCSGV